MAEAGSGRWLVVALGSGSGGRPPSPAGRPGAGAGPRPRPDPVPGAPPALAGLAGLSGRALPVLDLARLLDPEAAPPLPTRMVVAEAAGPGRAPGCRDRRTRGGSGPGRAPGPAGARRRLPAPAGGGSGRAGASGRGRAAAAADARVALLALTVAGRPYALPLAEVEAVLHRPRPRHRPGPRGLSWRGRPLPLLCLATRLGFGAAPPARRSRWCAASARGRRVGPVLRLDPGRSIRCRGSCAATRRSRASPVPGTGIPSSASFSARALAATRRRPPRRPPRRRSPRADGQGRDPRPRRTGLRPARRSGAQRRAGPRLPGAGAAGARFPRRDDARPGRRDAGDRPRRRRLGLPAGGRGGAWWWSRPAACGRASSSTGYGSGRAGRTLDPAALLAPAGGSTHDPPPRGRRLGADAQGAGRIFAAEGDFELAFAARRAGGPRPPLPLRPRRDHPRRDHAGPRRPRLPRRIMLERPARW